MTSNIISFDLGEIIKRKNSTIDSSDNHGKDIKRKEDAMKGLRDRINLRQEAIAIAEQEKSDLSGPSSSF